MSRHTYTGTTNDSDAFRSTPKRDAELGSETDARSEESDNLVKLKSGKRFDKTAKHFTGTLLEVKFSGANDFVICNIDKVMCKGKIKDPVIGASYAMTGKLVFNDKFKDWNFEFDSYEAKIDEERGLVQYLAREAPGVGPAMANKLVALHGFGIMDTLRSDGPVAGLTDRQHKDLKAWAEREGSNSGVKERLYAIGLSVSQVNKLLNHYGHNAEDKIRNDCFSLTEIKGFGFKTVSAIANLLGIPTHDKGRIKAAIVYAADYLTDECGHVHLTVAQLVKEACALLSLNQDAIIPVMIEMLQEEELLVLEKTSFRAYVEKYGILLV
jgi:ATP-dependent exoDNAse (exonuclease V) alpha subunit